VGQAPVDEQCACGGEPQATGPAWERLSNDTPQSGKFGEEIPTWQQSEHGYCNAECNQKNARSFETLSYQQ
jgi:hypothetical protein